MREQTLAERLISGLLELKPWLDCLGASLRPLLSQSHSLLQRVAADPPTPGIEVLLVSELGHDPLQARFMARVIRSCGERWAAERINIEKPLASALRRLAKQTDGTPLLISRRAKSLRRLLDDGSAEPLLRSELEKSGLQPGPDDFYTIIERACNRDGEGCRFLVEAAKALVHHLPDPRGRPLSTATGMHLLLLWYLGSSGRKIAYTWSEDAEQFVDPATRATRLVVNDPDFDPRPAWRLYKAGTLLEV